jgi:outer membrane porin, OprD family
MFVALGQRRILVPVAIALCLPTLAGAGQEALNVEPASDASAQAESPLERSFKPGPLIQGVNGITDLLRDKLKDTPPFFRDTALTLKVRSYYLNQDRPDGTRSEAWTLGGSLAYTSGRYADRLQIGAELFTSQPLYAPEDADGTLLLKPGQEGYTVLGQLYAKLRVGDDDVLTVGRSEFSTPYVNRQFNRMTPNTFEAIALKGAFTGLYGLKFDYEIGYLSQIKLRNADDFIPMSQAVSFATTDQGTVLAQALLTVDDWAFGLAEYFTPETLNIFYAEATWAPAVEWPPGFKLSAQFTDERETAGATGLSDQVLSRNIGLQVTTSSKNAVYKLAVSTTDPRGNIISPWGSNPTYTNPVLKNSNRAGEEAALFSAAYDFAGQGIDGLSGSIILAAGWNARDPVTGEPLPTQSELDLTLDYRVPKGVLRGLWLRLQRNQLNDASLMLGGEATTEWRAIVYWEIPLI